jgi:hypothetical protein
MEISWALYTFSANISAISLDVHVPFGVTKPQTNPAAGNFPKAPPL